MATTKFSNEGRNFKILGFELAPENFSYSTETTAIFSSEDIRERF